MADVEPKAAALRALHAAHAAIADSADAEERAVIAARRAAVTWREIAEALGMHEPNVIRRFRPRVAAAPAGPVADGSRDDAVAAVRAARQARRQLDDSEVAAVAAARNAGATWQEIADTVGMKQPNAVAKFRPLLEVEQVVRVAPGLAGKRLSSPRARGGA